MNCVAIYKRIFRDETGWHCDIQVGDDTDGLVRLNQVGLPTLEEAEAVFAGAMDMLTREVTLMGGNMHDVQREAVDA